MKLKCLFSVALLLAIASIGFAQSKTKTLPIAPDVIVKNLYAADKAGKSPFFQTKDRALVDRYFAKDFADRIWNSAVKANGEEGAPGFAPLYHAQDTKITGLKIGKSGYWDDLADVSVNFKNMGKDETILFRLKQESDKTWKIINIIYPNAEDTMHKSLFAILSLATDAPFTILGEMPSPRTNDTGGGEMQGGKAVKFQSYRDADYFVENDDNMKGNVSFLVFTNREKFDRVFHPAAHMGDNHFLPDNVFDSKLVIATTARGNFLRKYELTKVTAKKGELYVWYNSTDEQTPENSWHAHLILTVDKNKYSQVIFMENGKRVGATSLPKN